MIPQHNQTCPLVKIEVSANSYLGCPCEGIEIRVGSAGPHKLCSSKNSCYFMDEGCDSEHVPVQFKFKHVESEKIGPSLVL